MTFINPNTSTNDISSVHTFHSPFLLDQPHIRGVLPHTIPSDPISPIKTAMIILNRPIRKPLSSIFKKLWSLSTVRICADGGANRLYDATIRGENESVGLHHYVPDLICGDLDSVREDTLAYYKSLGILIEQDGCQDRHDLDKALRAFQDTLLDRNRDSVPQNEEHILSSSRDPFESIQPTDSLRVFVYGAFGGRLDHEMAAIQTLYRWGERFQYNIYLYNDETCAFLLPAGKINQIQLPNYGDTMTFNIGEGPTCGIIPFGTRCESIRTKGLKWDLDGSRPSEFGGLVSTSNKVMDAVVTIISSHDVVFTAEIQDVD